MAESLKKALDRDSVISKAEGAGRNNKCPDSVLYDVSLIQPSGRLINIEDEEATKNMSLKEKEEYFKRKLKNQMNKGRH